MAQPARADREHDVVDRAAEVGLHRLDLGEVEPHGGEVARAAHRPVQARVRRADDLLADDQLGGRTHALERLARVQRGAEAGPRAAQDQARREPEAAVAVLADLVVASRKRERSRECGVRGGVEQQVADVERADAVDEAVVRLGRQRPAPALEPVEERHLPQRPVAVQSVGPEVPEPLVQLGVAAGLRAAWRGARGRRGRTPPRAPRSATSAARRACRRAAARSAAGSPRGRACARAAPRCPACRRPAADRRQRRADMHVRGVVDLLELEEHRVQHAELLAHVPLTSLSPWPRTQAMPTDATRHPGLPAPRVRTSPDVWEPPVRDRR